MTREHERSIAARARAQHGLVSAGDLAELTGRPDELRRRLRTGRWQSVLPGVLVSSTVEVTQDVLAAAAMLWEPTALLSHHQAAGAMGIWVPDPDRVHVTVPFASKRRSTPELEVVRTRAYPERCRTDGFLRLTPPARTLVDLGMRLSRRQLEASLLSAVRTGVTTAAAVAEEAERIPGRAGLADVRAVTGLWAAERESLLEDVLHAQVAAVTDLPVERQHAVLDPTGAVLARVDVAVVEVRVAFEADGLLFHSTDEQLARDQRRDRALLKHGWQTVRFREDALRTPGRVRAEVAALLRRRLYDLGLA